MAGQRNAHSQTMDDDLGMGKKADKMLTCEGMKIHSSMLPMLDVTGAPVFLADPWQ